MSFGLGYGGVRLASRLGLVCVTAIALFGVVGVGQAFATDPGCTGSPTTDGNNLKADVVALPSGGSINLTANCTYDLSSAGTITVDKAVTIIGAPGAKITGGPDPASSVNNVRIFLVQSGALALNNVALSDGYDIGKAGGEDGGAILVDSSSTLTMTGGSIVNSVAVGDGGAIYSDGPSTPPNVVLTDVLFSGNSATSGGALFQDSGAMTISGSTFTGNIARGSFNSSGGGAYYADNNSGDPTATITSSTFVGNSAVAGSAVFDYSYSNLVLANDTFTVNTVFTPQIITQVRTASTIEAYGQNNSGDNPVALNLVNDTVASNSVVGVHSTGNEGNQGYMTVKNTIVSSNNSANCVADPAGVNFPGGVIINSGNNLQWPGSDCSPPVTDSAFPTGDPVLGGLADNGGPTQTMALLPGSAAIGAGDLAACLSAPVGGVDERGLPRPGIPGLSCDVGAFEVQAASPVSSPGTGVLGTRVVSGRASARRLACYINSTTVAVHGRQIRQLVFSVGGHRLRTVNVRPSTRLRTLHESVDLSGLRGNKHTLKVLVRFAAGAGRAKTLHLALHKCPVAHPKFTG